MKAVAKPCPGCPFSRKTEPGALGGSTPEVYLGQTHGPFALPCHQHYADDPEWKAKSLDGPQCAGAAIFRTHVGAGSHLPPVIPLLPPNEEVFADEAEFLAHHAKISIIEARERLAHDGLNTLVLIELMRAQGLPDNQIRALAQRPARRP